MQFTRKSIAATFFCLLIFINPVYASEIKWKDLTSVEKYLLSEHKTNWNSYGDSKKSILLGTAKKKAKKLRKYEKWIKKNLTPKQKKQLKKNFKIMNDRQLKKYMNGLFKKYGRPAPSKSK